MSDAMHDSQIERELRRMIVGQLLDQPFRGEDPLAEQAVDSLGIEQLIEYVEHTYGVALEDDEVVEENFESLPALVALIQAKR